MDDELRDALRRVEPPAGFAGRVLERVRHEDIRLKADTAGRATGRSRVSIQASPLVRWAIAATVLAAIGGGAWYRVEEHRREGEAAKRQVLMSLNIAGSKLRSVQMKINHEQER